MIVTNPRLAVSACLLGSKVRYNGDACEFRPLSRRWSEHLDLLGMCPEVGIGLGVPRPTIRLSRGDDGVRLVQPSSGEDLTDRMVAWSEKTIESLVDLGIDGVVLKKDSPSCGIERVKVHGRREGSPMRNGTGIFPMVAQALHPQVPMIEEGRLNDAEQAEHFLSRVHFHHRWRLAGAEGWTAARLMAFHNEHKLFLVARTADGKRRLGRVIADGFDAGKPASEVALAYMIEAQRSLGNLVHRGRFAHAMERALARLGVDVAPGVRQDIIASIHDYRRGLLPRMAPMLLIDHLARASGDVPNWLGHLAQPVPSSTGVLRRV